MDNKKNLCNGSFAKSLGTAAWVLFEKDKLDKVFTNRFKIPGVKKVQSAYRSEL